MSRARQYQTLYGHQENESWETYVAKDDDDGDFGRSRRHGSLFVIHTWRLCNIAIAGKDWYWSPPESLLYSVRSPILSDVNHAKGKEPCRNSRNVLSGVAEDCSKND